LRCIDVLTSEQEGETHAERLARMRGGEGAAAARKEERPAAKKAKKSSSAPADQPTKKKTGRAERREKARQLAAFTPGS
jgi:hypothetical protein